MWILKFPVVTFYQKWYLKHEFMSKCKFGRNFRFSRVQFKVTFWFFTIVPTSSLFFLIILILLVIANIHWRATIDLQYKKKNIENEKNRTEGFCAACFFKKFLWLKLVHCNRKKVLYLSSKFYSRIFHIGWFIGENRFYGFYQGQMTAIIEGTCLRRSWLMIIIKTKWSQKIDT